MKIPRTVILGWLKGEIKRYEQHVTLFANDPQRLMFSLLCLRRTYAARHHWKRHK
jgi:hypothetical protein